jgi:hypothetical protein
MSEYAADIPCASHYVLALLALVPRGLEMQRYSDACASAELGSHISQRSRVCTFFLNPPGLAQECAES